MDVAATITDLERLLDQPRPVARRPWHLVRLEDAAGIGPTRMPSALHANEVRQSLRRVLAKVWEQSGRHPNLYFPRGYDSYGRHWWTGKTDREINDWSCALRVPLVFWDGVRDSQVAELSHALRHWFDQPGAAELICKARMQLTLLRIPDYTERELTVWGDHGQSIYHRASIDRLHAVHTFEGGVNWSRAARAVLEAAVADEAAFARAEAERVESWKRERRSTQAKLRRLRAKLAPVAA
jgi:hypothetical protein